MGEQYFKGILAAYLGANFFNSPVDEWQIDVIKENISHFCETKIERSFLSREEKEAQHFYGFSVQSYWISSVMPTSFRSVKGSVTATIGISADTRSMRGITATVYRNGKRFASGTCEDVVFYKGTIEYVLKGQVSLAEGVSTWDVIVAAFSFKASEYTVDFTVDIGHPDGRKDHVVRAGSR